MVDALEPIIMEREFETLDAAGNTGTIQLRIGQPYFVTENLVWLCPFQITGILKSRICEGVGIDAIDAFLNSLMRAKQLLEIEKRTQITWQGQDNLLFYPETLKDELPEELSSEIEAGFEKVFDEFFHTYRKK